MNLYFAGSEAFSDIVSNEPVNILISYYYVKNKFNNYIKKIKMPRKIFVDSGAFTAWTNHVKIDVDEYCKWLNTNRNYLYLFGQMDCIPGEINSSPTFQQVKEAAQKTWENYLYMREKIIRPEGLLYTFHIGEPFSYLKQALEWKDEKGNHIPYIALGGMVGKSYIQKKNFLDRCFSIIKDSSNPQVKVHTFGMTTFDLLKDYPIESADSTSWIMTGANGGISTDMGTIIVSNTQSNLPEHYSHLPQEHLIKFKEKILEYGMDLDSLATDYKSRLTYHLRYYRKKAIDIPKMSIKDFESKKTLF